MGLPQYRAEDETGFVVQEDSDGKEDLDLGGQPRVCVGCRLCGSRRSRLICSAEDIAAQWRFLQQFYRHRWRQQNAATATERIPISSHSRAF